MSSSTHKMAEVVISQSLSQTIGQMKDVVSPFVKKVGLTLAKMVESMHMEDYSRSVAGGGQAWWVGVTFRSGKVWSRYFELLS